MLDYSKSIIMMLNEYMASIIEKTTRRVAGLHTRKREMEETRNGMEGTIRTREGKETGCNN